MTREAIQRALDDRYRIEEVLASGAMGDVYCAEDRMLRRRVAIKVLHADFEEEPFYRACFEREAYATAKVAHPNIVSVYDFGQTPEGSLYLVMELLEGTNLTSVLGTRAPLSLRWIQEVVGQLLAGLAAAHDEGVVHRDLKPDNIRLTRRVSDDGRAEDAVKVCDFGLARTHAFHSRHEQRKRVFTLEGQFCGTPEYMSPEQAEGEAVDARSDVYACGVILYEMICGRRPFDSDSAVELALKHSREPVTPPSSLRPGLPEEWDRVILRAMHKKPDKRYQSARAMRAALHGLGGTDYAPFDELGCDARGETTRLERPHAPSSSATAPAGLWLDESDSSHVARKEHDHSRWPVWLGLAALVTAAAARVGADVGHGMAWQLLSSLSAGGP